VQVIYYLYTTEKPIYLLEIFGKNEKANLSAAQRNALAKVAAEIKQQLQRRQRRASKLSKESCRVWRKPSPIPGAIGPPRRASSALP